MTDQINTEETTSQVPMTWVDVVKAQKAQQDALLAAMASSPQFVSFQGGVLSVDGIEMPGNRMDVIVLSFVGVNAHYNERYNPTDPKPPRCYAIFDGSSDPTPHKDVENPIHATCHGCSLKEFGTDVLTDRGGKGCKDQMRVAVLAGDLTNPAEAAKSEIRYATIPVMSVELFRKYLKNLQVTSGLPTFAFITDMRLVRDPVTQFKVSFEAVKAIQDEALLMALYERKLVIDKEILFGFKKEDGTGSTTPTPDTTSGRKSKV